MLITSEQGLYFFLLDKDEKADLTISEVSSNGVTQKRIINISSEPGLYALVFRSRKPEARALSKGVNLFPPLAFFGGER